MSEPQAPVVASNELFGTTSTHNVYATTPDYFENSRTGTTPCETVIIPQSFFDGMADIDAGRVAPTWATILLPAWLVRLVWFRKPNKEGQHRE